MLDYNKILINIDSNKEYISAIVALFLGIFFLFKEIRAEINSEKKEIIEKHLITQKTIDSYIKKISKKLKYSTIYKTILKTILDIIDLIFGKLNIFSFKAYKKVILLSFWYSLLFYIISWFMGADNTIGDIWLIPNLSVDFRKAFLYSSLISIAIMLFISIISFYKFYKKSYSDDYEIIYNPKKDYSSLVAGLFLVIFITFFQFFYPNFNEHIEAQIFILFLYFFVIYLIYTFIPNLRFWFTHIKSVAIIIFLLILLIINMIYSMFGFSTIYIYILFIVLLPFINSIFDYISIYFSRMFAKRILETNSKIVIVFDILLDLVIAIVLLYALANTLYYTIDILNNLTDNKDLYIPIDEYKNKLIKNPFNKDVLWITLMLVSMLIPTLFHIFLAFGALIVNSFIKLNLHSLKDRLKKFNPEDEGYLKKEEIAKDLAYFRLSKLYNFYIILIGFLAIIILIITILFLAKIDLIKLF